MGGVSKVPPVLVLGTPAWVWGLLGGQEWLAAVVVVPVAFIVTITWVVVQLQGVFPATVGALDQRLARLLGGVKREGHG